MWMFTAALYVIAKNWKYLEFPSTSEWVNKLWYPSYLLYNGISLSNKKKQTTDTGKTLNRYQKHDAMWRKKRHKECKLNNAIEIARDQVGGLGLTAKGLRGLFGRMEMFNFLIVIVITWLYMCQNSFTCTLKFYEFYYM